MRRHPYLLVSFAAAAALALSGCSSSAAPAESGSPSGAASGPVDVVASTNVYGSIVEAIGGDHVTVHSLISNAAQDPHEFEASASDQLTLTKAQLIVENGADYDAFIEALVKASGSTAPIITAAKASPAWTGKVEGFNEHVWYSTVTVNKVGAEIAAELTKIDPTNAAAYAANAATFTADLAKLDTAQADIKAQHAGEKIFVTEPVPLYMTEASGLKNATPPAFSEAVEEGQDVPPATLLDALTILKSGDVRALLVNTQTAGAETTQAIATAKAAKVPVLDVMEVLPAGKTYLGWMADNISNLAAALKK